MTEYVPREEFDQLKAEVEQLKDQLKDSGSTGSDIPGLDHRDEKVLERLKEEGNASPRRTLQLYKSLTDISNNKTAKERAKNLRSHPEYQKVVA